MGNLVIEQLVTRNLTTPPIDTDALGNYKLPNYKFEVHHVPLPHPTTALEELKEDATLPNPVHLRDMILRRRLKPEESLELNRLFTEYQKFSARRRNSASRFWRT